MKRALSVFIFSVFAAGLLLGSLTGAAQAQSEYRLNLRKDFGFSAGGQIKGTFTISVVGPENIRSVTFLIDGQTMAQVDQAPFRYQFNTGSYDFGSHELGAAVVTTDGRTVNPEPRRVDFVTSQEESKAMTGILVPLLGGVLVVMAIGMGLQFLALKRNPSRSSSARSYGLSGGAICPHCKSPTPLHWWGINLSWKHKFDRCENCGRFAAMARVSQAVLEKAEEDERKSTAGSVSEKSKEVKLRSQLDNSRYTD